jgi:hypothetical protein
MVLWPLKNGPVTWARESHAKWAREYPVTWVREYPAKWAREYPSKWVREYPAKWARESHAKWAREYPAKWARGCPAKWVRVKWRGVAGRSETFAVGAGEGAPVAPVAPFAPAAEDVPDSSRAIYDEVLQPRLDRLILATSGEKKTDSKYDEDAERDVREATGQDIAMALGLDGKPSSSLKTAHEFRMISAFLCYCSQSMEKAALLERLGVGPPVYNDP